ncbi:MAG: hypothetical protein QM586_13015, partial [Xenophilus sp.]
LADLYEGGKGVPADPERALALYLLAMPQGAEEVRHRDRSAAELFRRLQPNGQSPEFHRLLERGGAPSTWLRSIDVRDKANDNRYALIRTALQGIAAANTQLTDSDPDETRALRQLQERAGIGLATLSGWGAAQWPAALVYLRQAGTPAATDALQKLEQRLPWRLVRSDGVEDAKNAVPATAAPATGKARQPGTQRQSPFNPHLLATQITGDVSYGNAWPIASGAAGDWALEIAPASINGDGAVTGSLADIGHGIRLALLRWQPASKEGERPVVTLRAVLDADAVLAQAADFPGPRCINSDGNGSGGAWRLASSYRWQDLGAGRRVLAASIGHSEGYAGGGGDFRAELLLDVRGSLLAPIACYAVDSSELFAGEWNPDGTRNHIAARSAWRMQPRPRQGSAWPDLRLQPTTGKTPSATLVWNAARGMYAPAPGKQ